MYVCLYVWHDTYLIANDNIYIHDNVYDIAVSVTTANKCGRHSGAVYDCICCICDYMVLYVCQIKAPKPHIDKLNQGLDFGVIFGIV